jgi:hypothetical protein
MDKAVYRRECLLRHPEFGYDLLSFHQAFPVCLGLLSASGHSPLEEFPSWLHLVIKVKSSRLLMVVPRGLDDLLHLAHRADLCRVIPPRYTLLTPLDGPPYFDLLGKPQADYEHAKRELLDKWPGVPRRILLQGDFQWGVRPTLLLKPEPDATDVYQQWIEECLRLVRSRELKMLVPIYADTTEEDLARLWRAIQPTKDQMYPKRRTRREQYGIRLAVWDTYQASRSFAEAARQLCMKESTVKSVYAMASRDILGGPDRRRRRQRLPKLVTADHCEQCPTCRGAQSFEQMCAEARAYACQDEVPLLGQLSSDSFESCECKRDDLAEADPSRSDGDLSLTENDPPAANLP